MYAKLYKYYYCLNSFFELTFGDNFHYNSSTNFKMNYDNCPISAQFSLMEGESTDNIYVSTAKLSRIKLHF
jgi:hypothetical protein